MISHSQITAARFTIEIAETGWLKNVQNSERNVERLKTFGRNIALDDFVTWLLSHVQGTPCQKQNHRPFHFRIVRWHQY